ncbi:uncharacterized protein LOC131427884 [Malaya genurostris]|uniref:uncharacterized protein LOC131427884 n=1 Tax=Malaya genurostris TaxID=325434 RepID=UPI0026F3E3EC|nr:uncharacterized protein LOC131427884 [Malaya genurostris]
MASLMLPAMIRILEDSGDSGVTIRALLSHVRNLPAYRTVPGHDVRQTFDEKLEIANAYGLVSLRGDRVRLTVNCRTTEAPSFCSALSTLEAELNPPADTTANHRHVTASHPQQRESTHSSVSGTPVVRLAAPRSRSAGRRRSRRRSASRSRSRSRARARR